MAGSDKFQQRMNRASQPIGGDFSNMPAEGSNPHAINSNEFMDRFASKNRMLSDNARSQDPDPTTFINSAKRTNPVDIVALDKEIKASPLYHGAKSKLAELRLFGDVDRWSRENAPQWVMPKPPKEVESPDFDAMYDRSRDDLDKLEI